MNSKMTSGPWKVASTPENADLWFDVEEKTFIVARVYADVDELAQCAEANARAIAAVPDLIATLQEELDAIRVWLCNESNADITNGMFISVDKIKTALAKAGV